MITVSKLEDADFTTIQAAIDSITEFPATIYVKCGIYYENIELRHSDITIIGEDREGTVITYNNYANMIMDDGSKRGTFRSYTFMGLGNNITLKNLTIENSSGYGSVVGQAIALFLDGDNITVDNCKLLGHQDTLFTGPLPLKEAKPGGFVGPTEFADRIIGKMVFTNCYIAGEIDFIFGSAIAYFDNCTLYCINRGKVPSSFITAPSTYEGCKYGYVFNNCTVTGNCSDSTCYLGRPWREHAKSVFLNCNIDSEIFPELFHDWNKEIAHTTAFFAIYNCTGAGIDNMKANDMLHILTDEEAKEYTLDSVMNYVFK